MTECCPEFEMSVGDLMGWVNSEFNQIKIKIGKCDKFNNEMKIGMTL